MSRQKFSRHVVLVFACVFGVSGPAMAEHAETVLKYNPGQPGHTNVYDTYIAASNPTTNYNGLWYGHITRKYHNPEKNTLVRFELPNWVYDPSVTIHSAKLGLWVYQLVGLNVSGDWVDVGPYRVNPNRDWIDSQATWNVFKGSSYWSTPGCEHESFDRVSSYDSLLRFVKDSVVNRYYEWTVTGSVNTWKSGTTNRGWNVRVFQHDGGPEEGISVNLTESSSPSYRPYLKLDWTQTPVANADGSYICDYLGSVVLNGSASYERDAGSIGYWAWDLTGDGNTDVTGVGPRLTWDFLVNTLGLAPGRSHTISLKVRDDDNEWSAPSYSVLHIAAVPEPATSVLFLSGLVFGALYACRFTSRFGSRRL